ncbi:Calx-beta domain-containing protein [Chitinophaga lutea]
MRKLLLFLVLSIFTSPAFADDPASRVLTVTAHAQAAEPAQNGAFRVALPSGILAPEAIQLSFTVSGTAGNGTDFETLPSTAVIPEGANFVLIDLKPKDDKIIEKAESVVLTLTGATTATTGDFTVSSLSPATTVYIADDDGTAALRQLSVTVAGHAAEPSVNGAFAIRLPAGYTSALPVTITCTIGGTARNADDYTGPATTVTLPAGAGSVNVLVNAVNDKLIEPTETVILTLVSGVAIDGNSAAFSFTPNAAATSATLNIADDDNTAANTTLSITATNGGEPATSGSFTISLPANIFASEDITLNYSMSGTATPGTDYTAITGTIRIPAGKNSVTVPLNMIDNTVIETTETAVMALGGASSPNLTYTISATNGSAAAQITDNDLTDERKIVSLTRISDAIEGGTNGQFRISLPPGVTSSQDVVVNFTASGTAASPADYSLLGLSGGQIVIPAGANETYVDADAVNDGPAEGPETVRLQITSASSALTAFSIDPVFNTADVVIVDANSASSTPLQIITGANAGEPATNATFTIKLAGVATSAWPVSVGYRISGSATSGLDYGSLGVITIPRNTNSISVTLPVLDDKIIEPAEALTITLLSGSATDGGGNAFIFPADPANNDITVNITDNDATLTNRLLKVVKGNDGSELGFNGSYVVSLPAGYSSSANTTLSYTMSGDAVRNADYNIFTITLPAYSNSITLPLRVTDDKTIEGDEVATLLLNGATDGNSYTYGADPLNNRADLIILDDDDVPENRVLSVAPGPIMGEPVTNGFFKIQLPSTVRTTYPITVNYTVGGTATGGADYEALAGSVVIAAGDNEATVVVTIKDDQEMERNETVALTITGGAGNGSAFTAGAASTGAVTIADNDNTAANTALAIAAGPDATEGAATPLEFTVSLPGTTTSSEDITVAYTVGGTATNEDDYAGMYGSVVIPAGQRTAKILLPAVNDQLMEVTESVRLTLAGGTSASFAYTGTGSASANILDDDNQPANRVLTVTKTADAAEPGAGGNFRISLPGDIIAPENITVNYAASGTAVAGTDYQTLPGTAIIPAGQNGVNVAVTVTDDRQLEPIETVVLTLNGGASASYTYAGTTAATVNIADDENSLPANKILTVTKTTDAAEPVTNGGFTISLPAGITSADRVTVEYTIGGTATLGGDHTLRSDTTSIPEGQPGVFVPVPVKDDAVLEPTETVLMTVINGYSSLTSFTGGSNATVNIADDESALPANLALTIVKGADGAEPGTNGSFIISLPGSVTSAEDITIRYIIGGTATANDDYVTLSGTAVIPAGQRSVTVPVMVKDDGLLEAVETVIVTLNGGSSASFTFTGNGSITVNITDNDNTPANRTLSIAKQNDAAEPNTAGRVTIALPAGIVAPEAITVSYTTSGTATSGTDYTPLTGTAVIPAGENSVTVPVPVINDPLIEPQENVILTLTGGASANYAFTGGGNVTVAIADDDSAPANLVLNVAAKTAAAEPNVPGAFTVSLPNGLTAAENITVSYTTAGTAAMNEDYNGLTGTVIIPAGAGSVDVRMNVLNDQLVEGTENVTLTITGGIAGTLRFAPGTNKTASIDIADDDADPSRLVLNVVKGTDGAEPATNGSFIVSLPTDIAVREDVMVTYTVSGTATAGGDYTALSGSALISAGAGRVTIPVNVIDDALVEDPETVTLTIVSGKSSRFSWSPGPAGIATLTITSDDLPAGDLTMTKEVVQPLNGPYRLGQELTYRITVSNIGNGLAGNVVVTDTLPMQLGLPLSAVARDGRVSVAASDRLVVWTIGDMQPGASTQLDVRTRIMEGGALEGNSEVKSGTLDPDPTNNKAVLRLQIEGNDLHFGNVFTPNGDGKNERFVIGGIEKYPGAMLQVFNRWGAQVYRSNDYQNDWNGSNLNEGTYYYILEVKKPEGTKQYKGWVTILR